MAQRHVKGFPLGIFQSDVDSKFLCGSCHFVLRNPVQLCCGHRYCKNCVEIKEPRINHVQCECCIEEENNDDIYTIDADQVYPDHAIRREMTSLDVKCSACDWFGKLKDFTGHFEQHECIYGCDKQLTSGLDIGEHILTNLSDHFDLLYARLRHLEESSTNDAGSSQLVDRVAIVEQNLTAVEERVVTAVDAASLQRGMKPGGAAKARQSDRDLTRTDEQHATGVTDKLSFIETRFIDLNRAVNNLASRNGVLNTEYPQQVIEVALQKCSSLEQSILSKDAAVAAITERLKTIETTSYDGCLLWPITEVARRRQEAKSGQSRSIYSPAFYSSRAGYQLCARVYLDGDGLGKNTHLSLFIVVMRGNYDALLRWPFDLRITFILLNQQTNKDHIVDSFVPDPNSTSFQRPKSAMNVACGCPQFASLGILDGPTSEFVKEDRLFIKITVDTPSV